MVKYLCENEEIEFIKMLAQALVSEGPCVALLGNKSVQAQLILAQSELLKFNLPELMKACCQLIEGKGGGTLNLVQGGGKNPHQLQAALDLAESRVASV